MTKEIKCMIVIAIIGLIIYFAFFNKKKVAESNWKPEYADPNKLKRSMLGMASEGNSVAGMIANPKYGAMVHGESNYRFDPLGVFNPTELCIWNSMYAGNSWNSANMDCAALTAL